MDNKVMKDLSLYKDYNLKNKIKYVFTDVDDTITLDGKLIVESLNALWKLKEAGIKTICVTGGSTGWADIYLRQWPIDAVVTESGAIALYKEAGKYCRWTHNSINKSDYEEKKQNLIKKVMNEVPEARLSSDQFSRIYDVAFDHGSEIPKLNIKTIEKINNICKSCGANTAISSIHINAWFGKYDKKIGTFAFMNEIFKKNEKFLVDNSVYIGDSPNDQVMFEAIALSFAPVNIYNKADELIHKPTFVSNKLGGLGFADIVDEIIKKNEFFLKK